MDTVKPPRASKTKQIHLTSPPPSERTELLKGDRASFLGDPHFGEKWKSSFSLTQLLCKKKSCQENLFLATFRVDHQTKKKAAWDIQWQNFCF